MEAALRLGRIRQLEGNPRAAREAFAVAARAENAPFIRYLSQLFRAQLSEQEGDVPAAEQLYRESQALMPRAQAPALGLSRISDARGDAEEARHWLRRSLAAVGPEREDPWWKYARGQGWLLDERIAHLREMALR